MKPTLKRVDKYLLEITGLTCKCGGALRVKDWHFKGVREGRYEIYCLVCGDCDPNGWDRQDQILEGARDFFEDKEKFVPEWTPFEKWWQTEGQFIDPDTDDVPWEDKRRALAEAAFDAAMAQSQNYVADNESSPTQFTFGNGRSVALRSGKLYLVQ